MFLLFPKIAEWAMNTGWLKYLAFGTAFKILFGTFAVFILAPVLKWVGIWGIEQTTGIFNGLTLGTDIQAMTFSATGLMGWFFERFRLVECFSIMSSAFIIRFSLNPFKK